MKTLRYIRFPLRVFARAVFAATTLFVLSSYITTTRAEENTHEQVLYRGMVISSEMLACVKKSYAEDILRAQQRSFAHGESVYLEHAAEGVCTIRFFVVRIIEQVGAVENVLWTDLPPDTRYIIKVRDPDNFEFFIVLPYPIRKL